MGVRGPYAKGIAKREEILQTALEIIASHGYSGATVKELARSVGLSENGLLRYFGTKDSLFTEILRQRDDANRDRFLIDETGGLIEDFAAPLTELVRHNAEVPGLVNLYARLSSEASEPGHPSFEYFRTRYAGLYAAGNAAFRRAQEQGDVAEHLDADRLSVLMWSLIDGLQLAWMYDEDVDMAAVLETFLRATGAWKPS